MTKHTPGPWEHARMRLGAQQKDRRCGFVVNGPDDDGTPSLPVRICDLRVPAGVEGFSEGEANARLIAAAPELLAVCEWLMDYAPTGADAARCRAVIAKAHGREVPAPT